MTELVRTVRSGSVGLDLALGGGFRFVRRTRLADRESATVLIRGGPGTGKSVLAEDLALRLAAKLGGDVLYACVEVLPSEVIAQRMGFEEFDPTRVVDLSRQGRRDPNVENPYLVLGMQDVVIDAEGVPDLGGMLLNLFRIAAERGFVPKVVVVDSLSEGYALGNSTPRATVDGVCKLAVEQGWALILVEEVADASVSPWAFSVDTVLSLQIAPPAGGAQARRELLVTKHRFGSCEPGPHRLQIEPQRVRVIPPFSAYRNAVRDLELPPPAQDRSLRIPVIGAPPDWEAFRILDGEGRCIVVDGDTSEDEIGSITRGMGDLAADGTPATGDRIAIFLLERGLQPVRTVDREFTFRTLHQLIDGEDWLEDALTRLATWRGNLARVRIGPAQRVELYENAVDLQRAISLLAGILLRRGLVAVVFGTGKSTDNVIRASFLTDRWTVGRGEDAATREDQPTISAEARRGSVRFSPSLGT